MLEPFLGSSPYSNHGQRVVEGQRLMQAASDIFLGWVRVEGTRRVGARLLRPPALGLEDSADIDTILPLGLELYGQVCGLMLARAHARSGDRIAIASYLGKGDGFDRRSPSSRSPTPTRTSATTQRSRKAPTRATKSQEGI